MQSYVPALVPFTDGMSRVQQVVRTFLSAFKEQRIKPGEKLPSVRLCAQTFQLSTSTVVAAFDTLKEKGLIESQRGSGYYLTDSMPTSSPLTSCKDAAPLVKPSIELPVDDSWLLANVYRANNPDTHSVGCGWLPANWYAQDEIARALRETSRNEELMEYGYGDPYGNLALRKYLQNTLLDRSLNISDDQILLTSGASRALDLISSAFLNTGDTVLVDAPGYCNFLSSMLGKNIRLIGVRWTPEGPDIKQMEKILEKEQVKFYFTNPWLHNPTGASISLQVAHRLLNLAERHHITVVEDNVSGDLLGPGAITLAALAGLERVIHIGSFSKSVSPGFRVGYVAAAPNVINRLMQYKMMSGLTSSSLAEQVTLNVIRQPAYRKHLKALRLRLGQAQKEMHQFLDSINWDVFCVPDNGYYIYTRPHANAADSRLIAEEAKKAGLLFAPGYLFHPDHSDSPWIRFNVAFCQEKKAWLYPFLRAVGR